MWGWSQADEAVRARVRWFAARPDFFRLWAGESVSQLGTAITSIALPLVAISTLHATAIEVGAVAAAGQAPPLLFGLLIGSLVDRGRRRPVLIGANLGRAILLGTIPVAAALHMLTMYQLYVVAFVAGTLTVWFGVAYLAFVPSLVPREDLMRANSALELSRSAARIIGPNLGAGLVQTVSAPVAVVGDAVSFLIAAVFSRSIGHAEQRPDRTVRARLWREAAQGLAVVRRSEFLLPLAVSSAIANVAWGAQLAILILYMTRQLGLPAALLGPIFAAGNVGFLIGAAAAQPLAARHGPGRTLVVSQLVSILGAALIPLAGGPVGIAAVLLAAAQFLTVGPLIVYTINATSLRQAVSAGPLAGRVNATMESISWCTAPAGSVLGGWLGQTLGLRPTLVAVVAGLLLALPWTFRSSLRNLRVLPAAPDT